MGRGVTRASPWAAVVGVVLVAGCSLATPYPGGIAETDLLCHDGLDNDFDGAIDCRDTGCVCHEVCVVELAPGQTRIDDDFDGAVDCEDDDCTGMCPEDVFESCDDEIDQDGDGLSDWADPGCWPFADVERISCTSAAGCDYHLDFDNRGEYWTVHDDVLLPDPMGHAPGRSFVLPNGLTQAQATFGTDLTGAFMGTTIEADVYLDADTTLGLELRVTDAIWTSYGAAVWVGPDSVWAADELGVGLSRPGDMVGIDRPPGRYHVELLVDEVNGLRVRLRSWDGSYVREAGTRLVLGAFRPAPSLELGIIARRAAGTTGQLVVESITVHRDALDPCSHPAPSTRSPAGFFSNRGVARMQDGAICVAGWSNLPSPAVESGLFARSTDQGATWTYTPIDTGHLGFQGAWREPDRALHLAVASANGTWFWATTTDCVTISDVTSTFGASGRTAIGYGLVEDHRARVVTYELEDGTHYVYQSLADEGPTLREVDLGRVPRTAGTFFRPATATFAGNDVVIAYPELDYTIGVVSHGVRHETVVRPFLPFTRSGRSGACDAQSLTVEGVVVEIDERPALAGAAATGSVYYPCAPPGERPGLVRDTFSIRAPR